MGAQHDSPVEQEKQEQPQAQEVLTVDQALSVLAQVCAAFQGNLVDHQRIQRALQVVTAEARRPAPNRAVRRARKKA